LVAATAALALDAEQLSMLSLLRGHVGQASEVKRDINLPIECCAGFKDGTYFANVTLASHFTGYGLRIRNGYHAVDVQGERAIWVIGGDLPKNSDSGWFVRRHEDKLLATAWHDNDCVAYELDEDYFPRMCVGEGSRLPKHECTVNLDEELTLDIFQSRCGKAHWALNLDTCMPYAAFIDLRENNEDVHPLVAPLVNVPGLRHHCKGYLGMLFHDINTDCAADELFAIPAVCARARNHHPYDNCDI